MSRSVVLIAHNIRSSHNVGSLLRTAEGLGISKVYLTGYSPYPRLIADKRLPHLAEKQSYQINKTALGAEKLIDWRYEKDIFKVIDRLKKAGFTIAALEQTKTSLPIKKFNGTDLVALIVGNEVKGIDDKTLIAADIQLHLPMEGRKESFNVSIAAAVALYHLKLKEDGQIN